MSDEICLHLDTMEYDNKTIGRLNAAVKKAQENGAKFTGVKGFHICGDEESISALLFFALSG